MRLWKTGRSCMRRDPGRYAVPFSMSIEKKMEDKIIIKDLEVHNIIGVDSWERIKKQPIIINLIIDFLLMRS